MKFKMQFLLQKPLRRYCRPKNKATCFGGCYFGDTGITTSAADNAPIFNLAGQKVGKGYKGVVIKAGKKMIQ